MMPMSLSELAILGGIWISLIYSATVMPATVWVIQLTVSRGWLSGIAASAGLALGQLPWVLAASLLLFQSPQTWPKAGQAGCRAQTGRNGVLVGNPEIQYLAQHGDAMAISRLGRINHYHEHPFTRARMGSRRTVYQWSLSRPDGMGTAFPCNCRPVWTPGAGGHHLAFDEQVAPAGNNRSRRIGPCHFGASGH